MIPNLVNELKIKWLPTKKQLKGWKKHMKLFLASILTIDSTTKNTSQNIMWLYVIKDCSKLFWYEDEFCCILSSGKQYRFEDPSIWLGEWGGWSYLPILCQKQFCGDQNFNCHIRCNIPIWKGVRGFTIIICMESTPYWSISHQQCIYL